MTDVIALLSKVAAETKPEDYEKVAAQLSDILPPQFVNEQLAHLDTPDGYNAFYQAVHGFAPPKHIQAGVRSLFQSHNEGRGWTHVGWRGSWKSVSYSVTFTCWRILLEPRKTNLIIGANDGSAETITKAIAAMIAFHPAVKRMFPAIVPDTGRWSVEGYWVIDSSVAREQWAEWQSGVIDPTFVGGGHSSTRINGKHPTGVLCVDDIHDINNSLSDKERQAIVKTMTAVILKTAIRANDKLVTWFLNVGVPWAEDDSHNTLKASGSFGVYEVPAMTKAKEGEGVYIDGKNINNGVVYDDIIGWWHLTEPLRFGVNSILYERSLGKSEFWQMIMLDIHQAKGKGLKYYLYPHEKIDPRWQYGAGVDWATLGIDAKPNPGRDKFGLCVGAKSPLNQLIVVDVTVEQVTQADAERLIVSTGKRYSNWRGTMIEGDGGGEGFAISVLMRNPGIVLEWPKTGGVKKAVRQERQMGPWLENGTVLISDAQTPGLMNLRKALEDFPEGNNDVRDALYWLCKKFPDCLTVSSPEEELPSTAPRQKKVSPWALGGFRA